MTFRRKHLLGIRELEAEEIHLILDTAESLKEVSSREIKKVPTLRGRTVVNLFFEPSTRTRSSFEIAEKRLSADSLNFSTGSSAVKKGESLLDTARNLEAMQPDIIVMRHQASGACHFLAQHCRSSIINAGDGCHEHPTQALLDALTIREKKKDFNGLRVAIIGDVAQSRVLRSNALCLRKLGAQVIVAAPPTLLPAQLEQMGVTPVYRLEEAIEGADVIMMLRIQRERDSARRLPSLREYFNLYGLTAEKLTLANHDVIIMHPGPINRGVEIASEVADGPYSVILEQVTNGVAVRMAVLYLLMGEATGETAH